MPRKPGPRPRPSNVVALHGGSASEVERRAAGEVHPHPVAPKRPAGMTRYERECWDLHAAELDRLGLLTVLDSASFRLLCASYAMAREALDSMRPADRRRKGLDVVVADTVHGGTKRHPGTMVFKQFADTYRAWCVEFGMTPSSRVGLRAGAPIGSVPDDDDNDDAFFGT